MEEQNTVSASALTPAPRLPIAYAKWPECAPPENDAYFSIYCGVNDLHWTFHRPNGTWVRWRVPHILNDLSEEVITDLRLQFPPDTEALKYVLGDELSFPGALMKSKERSSSTIYVFYLDNPLEDKRLSQQTQLKQFELLSKIWGAVPCVEYMINKKQIIETSPLLKTHDRRIQDFSLEMISAFWIATEHYKYPLLTLLETDDRQLHYIGSWGTDSGTFFITGSLSVDSGSEDSTMFDDIFKVLQRWKTNAKNVKKGNGDLSFTIALASDCTSLESKLIKTLDMKEKSSLAESGYDLVYVPQPLLYGVNNLVDTNRVKKREEARAKAAEKRKEAKLAKKREKEAAEARKKAEAEARKEAAEARKKAEAEARKKAEKEKKRQKALEKIAQKAKDSESNGIEKGKKQTPRKRKAEELESDTNDNEKDGIEYLNMKVAKEFDDGLIYFGVVKEHFEEENGEPEAWNVVYDDGDGEDLEREELLQGIAFCKKIQRKIKSGKKVKVFSP